TCARSGLGERAVDEMHGDCAFADGGRYALHVARAHISDGEYARKAGFKHLWRTRERPNRRFARGIEIAAGQDETFVIEREASAQPIGAWGSSGHDED